LAGSVTALTAWMRALAVDDTGQSYGRCIKIHPPARIDYEFR
jgi:hypothetical protein